MRERNKKNITNFLQQRTEGDMWSKDEPGQTQSLSSEAKVKKKRRKIASIGL